MGTLFPTADICVHETQICSMTKSFFLQFLVEAGSFIPVPSASLESYWKSLQTHVPAVQIDCHNAGIDQCLC